MSVFHDSQSRSAVAPLATVEIAYRINLLCDSRMHTVEGRTNVGVFTLAGEPVIHLDSLIRDFAENLGPGEQASCLTRALQRPRFAHR